MRLPFGDRAGFAGPAPVARVRPARDALLGFPVDEPMRGLPVVVENERTAVDHQFALPADAVEADQRQFGFVAAAPENLPQPAIVLVDLIRAAVNRADRKNAG